MIAVVKANANLANNIIKRVASLMPPTSTSEILSAAKYAIMTDITKIPENTRKKVQTLWGPYLGEN